MKIIMFNLLKLLNKTFLEMLDLDMIYINKSTLFLHLSKEKKTKKFPSKIISIRDHCKYHCSKLHSFQNMQKEM